MLTIEQVENATVRDLREMAKTVGLVGASRMSKEDIQSAIIAKLEQGLPEEKPKTLAPSAQFYKSVTETTDLAEIERICKAVVEELGLDRLTGKSKLNKTQSYTTRFKDLSPTPETQHLFYEYQREGKEKSVSRHIIFNLLGLDNIDTTSQRAQQSKSDVIGGDILEVISKPNNIFSVEKHFETIKRLINSNDIWELATGLIAVSGCRPIEIIYRASFEVLDTYPAHILHPSYGAFIKGRAKKRGKLSEGFVSLLIESGEFIERLNYFRSLPEIKELHDVGEGLRAKQHSEEEINELLDNRYGKYLREITKTEFSFLPKIDADANRVNILLRATYSKLIAYRDLPNTSTSENRLKYAGLMTGHISTTIHPDGRVTYNKGDEKNLANTLHYSDYEPDTQNIPFLTNVIDQPQPIKETEEMARIKELETLVEELQAQLANKNAVIMQQTDEIETLKGRLTRTVSSQKEVSEMSFEELQKTRKEGSSKEKIRRAWNAITNYNNSVSDDRLNPTMKILSEMTGVNRTEVSRWINDHKDEVESHRAKFEMNDYYNNRYRKHPNYVTTDMLIEIITRDYMTNVE